MRSIEHKVQRGDTLFLDQLAQIGGIAMPGGLGDHHRAPVSSGQKNSQTETSKL